MKIILDTNFLVYCAKEKLDYFEAIRDLLNEDYELVVAFQVIEELEKLKINAKKGKDKDAASLALQLLEKNKIKKVKAEGKNVDDALIALSRQDKKNIVCTLDREMRWKLGRVILIQRGRKLMLTR